MENKRKCKQCLEVFLKQRPLDMFCSITCAIKYKAGKKNDKKKVLPAQISEKRLKELSDYRKLRQQFLKKDENKICKVSIVVFNKHNPATEIHHTNGRNGNRLNDTNYWIAVSRDGHNWIHANPEEARKLGFLM